MRRGRGGAALVAAPALAACAASPEGGDAESLPLASGSPGAVAAAASALVLTYLGAGGWLFRQGEASLLTAPFFSNPGVVEVGIARLEPDTVAIEAFLPPVDDVPAILVGHGHYDHLMDVPWIARNRAPRSRIYGSTTVRHTLLGDPELDPMRLVAVEEDQVGSPEREGRWHHTPDGRVRFMALAADHAPHLLGVRLYSGDEGRPRSTLPQRAHEWLDGPTLAWLVDFLDEEGEVLLRVHYQDAASEPPLGFPPGSLLPPDGRKVDVTILCVAGSGEADGYPEALLRALEPSVVLLGHWEDFFRPLRLPVRPVPGTDVEGVEARVREILPQARVVRPVPGEVVVVPPPEPAGRGAGGQR
jgi:hypothetical protein